ncbi:AAA family ATPase [Alloscardovia macacae]|uniref:Carboxylate--amine ligase n=1 Tax=Alloscardovia macacae TaxID=1160091 RepID=A0A261F4N7_9BIFI|nr:AAA family ATPase [Alloscardovia macacae]OZG54061.1 carboxylate--amine ligase [Alloscardovia macacae]
MVHFDADINPFEDERYIREDDGYINPFEKYVDRSVISNVDSNDIGRVKRLKFTPASEVKTSKQHYIDFPAFPLDMVTLISGRAGVGKSTYALYKLARATEGSLEGDYKGKPINVAIFAKEDTQSMQKARLQAAGANLEHVYFGDAQSVVDGVAVESDISIPDDLPAIRQLIEDYDIRMLCIDPLNSYMSGDTNRKDDVRRALDPLARLAQQCHVSILGIVHFNKGGGYASDKMSGSHAFRDIARSVLLVAKNDETGECVVTLDKSQYTQSGQNWKFNLQACEIRSDDGERMSVARVANVEETDTTVNDVININIAQSSDAVAEARDESMSETLEFLIDFLQENEGHASTKDIKKAGREAGYDWKQLTNVKSRNLDRIKVTRTSQRGYEWALTSMVQTSFDGLNKASLATHEDSLATHAKNEGEKLEREHSQGLSDVFSSSYSATQEHEKPLATHILTDGEKLENSSISNTSSFSQPKSSQNVVSSQNVEDLDEWEKTLPAYASDLDYSTLTVSQLDHLAAHKPGLWAQKARDEKKHRSQLATVENN